MVGVCGVCGLCADGLGNLMFGGLGASQLGSEGGELLCRATLGCSFAGGVAGVGEGGLVMEWISLAGFGAVGGGAGFVETGGGIFFPST